MIEESFKKEDRFIAKVFASIILFAVAIFGIAHFDKPMSTGESVWGTVVSVAGTATGYRNLTATTSANVRLDNGKAIYTEIYGASSGNRIEFRISKTRFLRRVSYHAIPRP